MRVIFSGTGFIGHLVPMFPLIRAFVAAGHDVAVLTSVELEQFLHEEATDKLTILMAGPPGAATMKSMQLRWGTSPATQPIPAVIAEFFAGQQLDAGLENALGSASEWAPDLLIGESMDYVGSLVAAKLSIPFYRHTFGPTRPMELTERLHDVATERASAWGLSLAEIRAVIDIFPSELQEAGAITSLRRLPLRPEIHSGSGTPRAEEPTLSHTSSPQALVTFGTVFTDPVVRDRVVDSLDQGEWDIAVTTGAHDGERLPAPSATRRYLPFTPLSMLLPEKDLIVTAGGAGTVLSALTAGVPMVILPLGADHGINAARAEAAGVAVVVHNPDHVGEAAARILADPAFRNRSQRIAAEIARLPSADAVVEQLVREMGEDDARK